MDGEQNNLDNTPQGEIRLMSKDLEEVSLRDSVLDVPTPPILSGPPTPPISSTPVMPLESSPQSDFNILDLEDINIPMEQSQQKSSRAIIITVISALVILLIVAGIYLWSNLRSPKEQMVKESAPTETFLEEETAAEPAMLEEIDITEEPEPTELPEVMPQTESSSDFLPYLVNFHSGFKTVSISLDKKERNTFIEELNSLKEIETGKTVYLKIKSSLEKEQESLDFKKFIDIVNIKLPENLFKEISGVSLYLYKPTTQEISFCKKTKITNPDCKNNRLSLVFKINSLENAEKEMRSFEETIKTDLTPLITAEVGKPKSSFKDAVYKKIKLRYQNYPLPPSNVSTSISSINYVFSKISEDNFLIISTSRLGLYSILNQL